jgi:hypothetical protein
MVTYQHARLNSNVLDGLWFSSLVLDKEAEIQNSENLPKVIAKIPGLKVYPRYTLVGSLTWKKVIPNLRAVKLKY